MAQSKKDKEERRKVFQKFYAHLTTEDVRDGYNFTTEDLTRMDELGEIGADLLDDAILALEEMRSKWAGYPLYLYSDELIQSFQILYPTYWTQVLTAVLGSAVGRAAGLNDNFDAIVKDINEDDRS